MKTSPATVAAWLIAFPGLAHGLTQWKELGCYADGKPSTLSKFLDIQTFLTPSSCQQACGDAWYKFAGLMEGNQCWCGNAVNAERVTDASKCDVNCDGYPRDICGGVSYLSIYEDSSNTASADPSSSTSTTSTSAVLPSTVLPSTALPSTVLTTTVSTSAALTSTASNATASNPATQTPPTSNPNSANGLSSVKLEALFILAFGWAARQYL